MDESAKVISGLAVSMMLTEEWKSNPLWWQACRLRRIMVLQPTRLPLQKANQQRGAGSTRCADSRKLSGQRGVPGPRRS